jgi:glutamyl-tRNA synthetase
LDHARCRQEWVDLAIEDLRWLGLDWQEGPDRGGDFGPYHQSQRMPVYRDLLARLQNSGAVYPCYCSRRDIARAVGAPHAADEEPLYPGYCRPDHAGVSPAKSLRERVHPCWRFRVPEGEAIEFPDGALGPQHFIAGRDFGDFVVWSRDDIPSYQLAVVADDTLMQITEVVRGADLLLSTARQILLYRALHAPIPAFYHCPLVTDSTGARLAKRHNALSLRHLRREGVTPTQILGQGPRVGG